MKREDYPTPLDWYVANEKEYRALSAAEDGNLRPLAEYIEQGGVLATREACAFVAARLRGDKRKKGQKRTIRQQTKEIIILGLVRDIQAEQTCSEYAACMTFLERHADLCADYDALRTFIRRAKASFKNALGKEPPPVVPDTM
jgi:hypothetical protein